MVKGGTVALNLGAAGSGVLLCFLPCPAFLCCQVHVAFITHGPGEANSVLENRLLSVVNSEKKCLLQAISKRCDAVSGGLQTCTSDLRGPYQSCDRSSLVTSQLFSEHRHGAEHRASLEHNTLC